MNISFASRMPVMNNTRRLELEQDDDPWSGYADTMETDAPARSSASREVRDDEFAAPTEMPNAWAAAHSRLQDRHNYLTNQAHEISRRSYAAMNYGAFNPGYDPMNPMMGMQPGFAPYDPNMQPGAYGPPLPGQPLPGQPMLGQPLYGQPLPGQPFTGQPGQALYPGQMIPGAGGFGAPPQLNGLQPFGPPTPVQAQESWRATMANHSNLPSGPMYQPAAPAEPQPEPEPVNFEPYGWSDAPAAVSDDTWLTSN